ncbi:MAG: hypothetical protein AAB510_02940 [Patescibacteria group bacterium]
MKYKRQLMGSMMALALFVGNPKAFDIEDSVHTSKVGQYINQLKMRSDIPEDSIVKMTKK